MNFDNDEDYFQDLYEEWIDMINANIPLRPNVLSRDVENSLRVNQQIATRIHNIRRHLELGDFDPPPTPVFRSPHVLPAVASFYGPGDILSSANVWEPVMTSRVNGRSRGTIQHLLGMQSFPNLQHTTVQGLGSSVVSEMFRGLVDLLMTNEVAPRGDFEDVKVVLQADEFDNLEKLTVDKENVDEYGSKECNVCIESYKEGDNLTRLPCNHVFHEECIKNWLCNENVKCPVCRSDTRQKSQEPSKDGNCANDGAIDSNCARATDIQE